MRKKIGLALLVGAGGWVAYCLFRPLPISQPLDARWKRMVADQGGPVAAASVAGAYLVWGK